MAKAVTQWDGTAVRAWLASWVASARADQVRAERRGREGQGDCAAPTAEEMVCTLLARRSAGES